MTIKPELLDLLRKRREKIINHIKPEKLEAMHAKGVLSARERIDNLFDAGTFQEIGMHAEHHAVHFGMEGKKLPADGVITGSGYLGNKQIAAFCQDFSVQAGSLGKMQARKITRIMRYAIKIGVPVVAFKDSGGARIQEGVDALSGYGDVFYANVLLSGVVPQIAIICGPCAGGAAYSPALMDFVVMTRKNSQMFLTGPEVIKAVTGRTTTMAEIGSAEMHASVSGNAHFIAEDDQPAVFARLCGGAHRGNEGRKGRSHAEDVDLEDAPDDGEVFCAFGQCAGRDAGIGDDDVGCAVACDEVLRRRAQGIDVGDVERITGNVCRAQRFERSSQRLQLLATPCGEPENGTLLRVVCCQRAADARRSAGDEDLGHG